MPKYMLHFNRFMEPVATNLERDAKRKIIEDAK